MIIRTLKLYRSDDVELAWQARKLELIMKWKKDHPGWEYTHLFDYNNGSLNWLKSQGVDILIDKPLGFAIITNDFKYEDIKIHLTIIPLHINILHSDAASYAAQICEEMGYEDYAIVKKSEGSINFPHWHLLIY